MTDDVISGTYSDLKVVRTRGVVQIVVEVPLEEGQRAIDLLGLPNPSEEVHVAVARLKMDSRVDWEEYTPFGPNWKDDVPEEPKPKSYAKESGILSNDAAFMEFVRGTRLIGTHMDAEIAAEYIREKCDVTSRRDLIEGTPAGDAFRDLKAEFTAWKAVG